MSDAFITRRGGSGGLSVNSAVLHINTSAGSTITLSKGGLMVKVLEASKGHTNSDGISADWYYSVGSANYGAWTITATKDGETTAATVTIDSAKQYDVPLSYNLYLIKDGVIKTTYGVEKNVTVEQYSDSVGLTFSANESAFYVLLDNTVLDSTRYTKLVLDFVNITGNKNYALWGIRTITTGNFQNGWLANATGADASSFPFHSEIDISHIAYSGKYFDLFIRYSGIFCELKNIYLAR